MLVRRLLPALVLLAVACGGAVDPQPPEDEEVVPVPGPFDDYLRVVDVSPDGGEVGLRPTVRVTFDTYLEDDELLDYAAIALESGGLRIIGRVDYEMTTRSLVFRPLRDLVEGLTFRVVPRGEYLVSVTGAPFEPSQLPTLVATSEDGASAPERSPEATWDEVDAILERKCRECHSDPTWDLNPLTRRSMIGVASEQTGVRLVVAYDPADSYLMHKILPDYPIRRFTIQPPPWSGAEPLDDAERLTIETWIRNGAR